MKWLTGSFTGGALTCAAAMTLALTLGASTASAVYIHPKSFTNFGSDGTSASSITSPHSLAYDQTNERLYALTKTAPRKIHGFAFEAPGDLTPLGGAFPLTVEDGLEEPDIAVDNGSVPTSNLFYSQDGPTTWGFDPTGVGIDGFPVGSGGEVCGTAVDRLGNVWVGNYGTRRVQAYAPFGGPPHREVDVSQQGRPCDVEIDRTTGDLYVSMVGGATWRYSFISDFSPESATPFYTGERSAKLAFNPGNGRLYAASDVVRVYSPHGFQFEEFGSGSLTGIAVDEVTDTVFVANAAVDKIEEWRGAILPNVVTGQPTGDTAVAGTVAPAGGGPITECYFEFNDGSSDVKVPCAPSPPYTGPQSVHADLPGLVGENFYFYRLVAGNANGSIGGGSVGIFPRHVDLLKTESATNLQRNSATLNGSFEGTGLDTHYYFEWGETTDYATKSATPPGDDAGITSGPTPLSFNATGLEAGTTYHYRVVAENSEGATYGNDEEFTTSPAVQDLTTEPATDVVQTSATLNASYLGDGAATSYYFEYGKTTAYGKATSPQNAGPAVGATQLFANIGALDAGTTYHYRVVATNGLGTSVGEDESFSTLPAVAGTVTKPATGISQTTITLNGEFTGVGEDTHYYFEWGPTTAYGERTAVPPGDDAGATVGTTPVSSLITDYKGYSTYHYRLVASNSVGTTFGNDQTFVTLPGTTPAVAGTTASDVGPSSAVLGAMVTPNRSKTEYRFEYGPSGSYGSSTESRTIDSFDDSPHAVTASVSGLVGGTIYHYRVIASNLDGTVSGPDQTFVTPAPPAIERSEIGTVGRSTAKVSALVKANSSATVVRFEYGTSRAYGKSFGPIPGGSATGAESVSTELTSLAAGTVYHLRVTAVNGFGTTRSADLTFKTTGQKGAKRCKKGQTRKRGKCVKKKRRKSQRQPRSRGR